MGAMKISQVKIGADVRLEVTCIVNHEEYCSDKPRGYRFKDGCRGCKCNAEGATCQTEGCVHFLDSEVRPEVYCKQILRQNYKNLQLMYGDTKTQKTKPTKMKGSGEKMSESKRSLAYTGIRSHKPDSPSVVQTTGEINTTINDSNLKPVGLNASSADLRNSQSLQYITLERPDALNESSIRLSVASLLDKQNVEQAEHKHGTILPSLKESALHANREYSKNDEMLKHYSAQPQKRSKIKHEDSKHKASFQGNKGDMSSLTLQKHSKTPSITLGSKQLNSQPRVPYPNVMEDRALEKMKNIYIHRSPPRKSDPSKGKPPQYNRMTGESNNTAYIGTPNHMNDGHKVTKHLPDSSGTQRANVGLREYATVWDIVKGHLSNIFQSRQPAKSRLPDGNGKEQGVAFLGKVADLMSKFLNQKYPDKPPSRHPDKEGPHHGSHRPDSRDNPKGGVKIRFFTAYGDISGDSLDEISRELVPKLAKGIHMQVTDVAHGDNKQGVSPDTTSPQHVHHTDQIVQVTRSGKPLFTAGDSFFIQARILNPAKATESTGLTENSDIILPMSETSGRMIRFQRKPLENFNVETNSAERVDTVNPASKQPAYASGIAQYSVTIDNKMKIKFLLKKIVELQNEINYVTTRLKRCTGYRKLMRKALNNIVR